MLRSGWRRARSPQSTSSTSSWAPRKSSASWRTGRLIIRTPEGALEDSTLSKCRSAIPGIAVYYDDFGETAEILARRIYTEPGRWPLIIVADSHTGQLEAVYGTSGYNVGTGDMLLRVMRAEEKA